MMDISIVIPTHNRKELLQKALISLSDQTYPKNKYEVLVADDGSTDGTGEMVRFLKTPYPLSYRWQENKGRSGARNLGVSLARGDLTLFLDDDVIAHHHLLEEHVGYHETHPNILVMGGIKPAAQLQVTTLFTTFGLSKAVGDVADVVENGFVPFVFCATLNLSIRRHHLLVIGLFDEDFREYGWEDVDFGYRAHKAGLSIMYNPRAIGYHAFHATDLKKYCALSRVTGRSAVTLLHKYPELLGHLPMLWDKGYIAWRDDPLNIILRKLARSVMILPPVLKTLEGITSAVEALWPSPVLLRPLYRWVVGSYIFIGFREGLRARDKQETDQTMDVAEIK